jgi:CelD/BcsL family acetyltransferase involved in cellulose biosynthesis
MLPVPLLRPDRRRQPLRVEWIADAAAFAALRDQWDDLLRASLADCVFLTWEWLFPWWQQLGGDRALQILLVWAGNELVGAAPLTRSRTTLPWLSRLEFLGTGFAGSDYLDVIVRSDREADAMHAIADAMAAANSTLCLDHLPPASTAARLVALLGDEEWTSLHAVSGTCPYIPLSGLTWESYLASIGGAHRANLRRRVRALDRQFAMRFVRVTAESDRAAALETLIALHNRRWDERGGSTAFATPQCRAFHDDATRRLLEQGWLRLYELRLNDVVAAATYCFSYGGRVFFYQGAFDSRYQQHSVGMVAMGLTIRAAIDEGAREFDLLWGVESYKWLWARHSRSLHRIELFPPGFAGRLRHRTVRAERTVKTFARRIFPRKSCTSTVPPAGVAC